MRVNQYTLINNAGYPSLIKECGVNYPTLVRGPKEIVEMMRSLFFIETKIEEEFWVLCLNNAGKVNGVMSISKGGYSSSLVDMKSLFTRVLLLGATNIIICHNHPSGDCNPSSHDRELTNKVKQASELLDIKLLDHVIFSADNYFSFNEGGCL